MIAITYKTHSKRDMDRLRADLEDLQGRAKERTLSVEDVLKAIDRLYAWGRRNGVTKKDLRGSKYLLTTYEIMPSAYKYMVSYTSCTIVFDEKGKVLVKDIDRDKAYPQEKGCLSQWKSLSDTAQAAIVSLASFYQV